MVGKGNEFSEHRCKKWFAVSDKSGRQKVHSQW